VAGVTTPIASGREADIFALDDRRVLRRYRRAADVTREAEAMAYAASHGFPVPAVYEAHGADMVLERLDGSTMLQAIVAGDLPMRDGAEILADLLRRLHEIPPRSQPTAEQQCLIHLDLHAENVMMTRRGPVVIDWCNATDGEADLDTGLAALIMAHVAVDPAYPYAAEAGEFLEMFLPVAPGDPRRLLDEAVARRAGQSTMTPRDLDLLEAATARVRGDG
jgi:aminoglycoside phosphotransferase (APT) family kinase protein